MLISHPDVSDALLLGSNSDFGHWDAYDAKHILHILGGEEQGVYAPATATQFPRRGAKRKNLMRPPTPAPPPPPQSSSPTHPASAGLRRSLSLRAGLSYLRFQGSSDDRGTSHLLLAAVAGLCDFTFRHLLHRTSTHLPVGSKLTRSRPNKGPGRLLLLRREKGLQGRGGLTLAHAPELVRL